MSELVLLRADASVEIGAGHVMRCLTLADRLASAGWRCRFLMRELPGHLGCLVESRGHAVALLEGLPAPAGAPWELDPGRDSAACLAAADGGRASWLVVDQYGLGARWESSLRALGARILALDDLADREHDCDLLADPTFGRDPAAYDGLVPPGCPVLAGARYALLRPQFARARQRSLARDRRAVGRLFVCMGGFDPLDLTSVVLDGIARSGLSVQVDVVIGPGSPNVEAVRRLIGELAISADLHVGPPDMAALMARADLAVGAGGTTSWERCCLGLPTLLAVLADNQAEIARALEAHGAVRLLGRGEELSADGVAAALQDLAASPGRLQEMSRRAAHVCDGLGARRVAEAMGVEGGARDG